MKPGGRQLFIYYRVDAGLAHDAIAAAAALQAELRARHPGLEAMLMRRPGVSEGSVTLMETYALDAPAGVDAALEADIERCARERLGASIVRHVEVFEPCAW
jgi:hypothetical protein